MKTKKLFLYLLGVFVVVAMVSATADSAAAACATCTSAQNCESGGSADHCDIFFAVFPGEEEEEQWCNTHGSCNDFAAISPGDLSPAGTVLTDKVVIGTDGTTVLAGCSDNIVRHSPNPVAPSLAGSVVTS